MGKPPRVFDSAWNFDNLPKNSKISIFPRYMTHSWKKCGLKIKNRSTELKNFAKPFVWLTFELISQFINKPPMFEKVKKMMILGDFEAQLSRQSKSLLDHFLAQNVRICPKIIFTNFWLHISNTIFGDSKKP